MSLRVPVSEYFDEFEQARSRFIGIALGFSLASDKDRTLRDLSQRFPKATHIAYAFRCGDEKTVIQGMSDAGEPKGTAGRPIMDVLMGSGVTNVFVAAIRYFGGIKLGTGGLVHAYGACAKLALAGLRTRPLILEVEIHLTASYGLFNRLEQILAIYNYREISREFAESVSVKGYLNIELEEAFRAELNEAFGAAISKNEFVFRFLNP